MIEDAEYRKNLIKIAEKLRKEWISIPTDAAGNPTETYLEYLSLMYAPEIAQIVHHLEVFPNLTSLLKFSRKVNIEKKELSKLLENVANRGFIVNFGKQYSLPTPLFVWDVPFIFAINYESEEAERFAQLGLKFFYDEEYYKRWETEQDGTPRHRVLSVSEEITPKDEIVPIEEVYGIIEQNDKLALVSCPCRRRQDIHGGRECEGKYPLETCILLGPYAMAALEQDDPSVREINSEDAKKIAKEAAEIGLVHTTDNKGKNCTILCACCECCCVLLSGLTRMENPRAIGKANYIATVDEEFCEACGTCVSRCKFHAIEVNEVAEINHEKCMGCGLCAITCPTEAISIQRWEREEIPMER
ncbi:MAG: 4Fe-4S dicluster domain-containing protein, partial [Candidatus Lokiarchaeota archaeon]|nr:4Fe-4S dicluster domain-containing protein [Candidatus Lokiarchaeota archaeon]MBD3200927.1 4Fe-4S dicluster domain-containing protein [Candidatus Lokiarchaeota archaeon]